MENIKTPIPRIVEQISEVINLNKDDNELSRTFNNKTWEVRFNNLHTPEGYNNGKRKLHCLSIENWKKVTGISTKKQVPVFIENSYFYNSFNKQKLFVDFSKLKYCDIILGKINYFSMYRSNDIKVHNFFEAIRKEGMHLVTKYSAPDTYDSITPELAVRLVDEIYKEEAIDNVLIMASDRFLLPFIQHFRSMSIKFTLAIATSQVVNNYYLNQFDYIIDAVELMKYADCIQDVRNAV